MPLGSIRDSIVFYESLRAMERGGVSIVRGLNTIAGTSPSGARRVVEALERTVAGGVTLSEAMERFPQEFPRLERAILRAGEIGGRVEEALDSILRILRRRLEMRNQIIQAAIYPIILVHVAMLVPPLSIWFQDGLFAYLATVLPAFGGFYAIVAVVAVLDFLAGRGGRFGALWNAMQLRVPILGRIYEQAALGRFARCLSALQKTGAPILSALDHSIETAGNTVIRARLAVILRGVEEGKTLSGAMLASRSFPHVMHALIETGELSGAMDDCLERLANHLDDMVNNSLQRLSKILPVVFLMLAMGYGIYRLLGQMGAVFSGYGELLH